MIVYTRRKHKTPQISFQRLHIDMKVYTRQHGKASTSSVGLPYQNQGGGHAIQSHKLSSVAMPALNEFPSNEIDYHELNEGTQSERQPTGRLTGGSSRRTSISPFDVPNALSPQASRPRSKNRSRRTSFSSLAIPIEDQRNISVGRANQMSHLEHFQSTWQFDSEASTSRLAPHEKLMGQEVTRRAYKTIQQRKYRVNQSADKRDYERAKDALRQRKKRAALTVEQRNANRALDAIR